MKAFGPISIRSKVAAALLAVSLLPMAVVGLVANRSVHNQAQSQAVDRLAGIAAVQEARVNAYALSSLESLALVASRTQLRISFARELDAPDEENVALMQRILADAVTSSSNTRRIEMVDLDGRVIASSDGLELGADRSDLPAFVRGIEDPDLSTIAERGDERFAIHSRPVSLDDRQLGVLLVETSLAPLDRLMTDYTGLGESGETILASARDQDTFELLGQVRSPNDLSDDFVIGGDLLNRALAGDGGDVSDQHDYRGQDVFAVARSVDAVPGWAVGVKIDQEEALAAAKRLRNVLIVAFGLAALAAAVAAWWLARTLTRPVLELRDAAAAVAGGDTDRRAHVTSNDELSELAFQFNRMTDELTEANARLRLTNEQLEEFVYISSHDLKSPLRSISSFGQLLQAEYGDVFDEQGLEYLGFIRDGTARMHGVIEDLLDYLRIEKVGHVVEPVDLDEILDDILDLHRLELAGTEVDIRRSSLPTVEGSSALLRQLFDNLVQNAIRYRRADRPLILDITAGRHRDIWQVAIADNGLGVPQDRRQEAFTVFKRLSGTGDGSGMGLAICRRIARRHGGDVSMADSRHGGVSLIVTLAATSPQQVGDADREPIASVSMPTSAP